MQRSQDISVITIADSKHIPIASLFQIGIWEKIGIISFLYVDYGEYGDIQSRGLFIFRVGSENIKTGFYEGDIVVINPYLKRKYSEYVLVSNMEGHDIAAKALEKE